MSPSFLTDQNLLNLINQASVVAIVAMGVTPLMVAGFIDLSIGATISMGAAVAAVLMAGRDENTAMAIVIPLALGTVIGLVNGVFVTKRGANSVIVTLGTAAVVTGLTLVYTGGTASGAVSPIFEDTFRSRPLGLPFVDIAFAAILILALVVERTTIFGKNTRLIGSNLRAADLSGIHVDRAILVAFAMSGLFASFAGLVLLGRVGVSSTFAGQGLDFAALTAVILGGASLEGGKGGILGTIGGVFLITISFNIVSLLGLDYNARLIVQGSILIASGVLYRITRR
jgi:ribose transport system permease protein